ncbi:MAG: pyridoxamine 5'-phosphate oxidase family protein [Cyclobacteriaceae bacterium]|nr:pyridoxamine 5'-phosphate oxidase family protein [Cyclobacteriaceae bacterium]
MIKYLIFLCLIVLSCTPKPPPESGAVDATEAARELIKRVGKCALITLDESGQPQVRTMDPFEPEPDFTIWLATNPQSRKVTQIENNPAVTLYYADGDNGYVSLYGSAKLINDQTEKDIRWKQGWEQFYPNRKEGYLLIKVKPSRMEIIDYKSGIQGDSITWQPEVILFKE